MEIVTLPVGQVQEWERNARIHTRKNLEALKQSLKKYGQTKPILVQKSSMRIIAGNGTYQAIIALGWETVDCRILDLNDSDSKALMIADNRIGDLSMWDEKNLLDALQSIKDDGNLELAGYDDVEFDKMLSFKDKDVFKDLKESPKEKPKPEDFPAPESTANDQKREPDSSVSTEDTSYEDQINFSINGFIFSLADEKQIQELRYLIDLLKSASEKERSEVNQKVFDVIEDVLNEKLR